MEQAIREAATKIARWRSDPIAFVREEFNVEPDLWQKDFLLNYIGHNRSGAKACKGPGKTAVLAWCSWHFLVCFPHPKVVATSITGDNLRDGLWAEMAKWQMKSRFLQAAYTWNAERITSNDHPETWFMSARKWSASADKEKQGLALAGIHGDYVLFLIDEAGGVPDAVVATAEAALANAGTEVNPNAIAKLLICGNPTHLEGPLYRACTTEASLWKMIEITGDPDDPKRSPRISVTWAREQIQKYGKDNPWVLVNVFGKFPPSSINALLGPDDVQAAMSRIIPAESYRFAAKVIGVDVALSGGDRTVFFPRQGLVAFKPKVVRLSDPKDIASALAYVVNKWEPDAVNIDNTGGWGSGVISYMRDWGHAVNDVMFSAKATEFVYYNKRAEMHHEAANWIKGGGCLPNNSDLKEEATAQTYTHTKGKLLMEDKDIIKEKIGRSPDLFDALALTFAFPVAPNTFKRPAQQQQQSNNYDPIKNNFTQNSGFGHGSVADYNPLS